MAAHAVRDTAARERGRWWCSLVLAATVVGLSTAARAELPAGWTVDTFTGRIHDIAPGGGVLACATDGGLVFFDPARLEYFPPIADAGCTNGECLPSNHLTAVARDASGNYWLGTEANGAVVFRPLDPGRSYDRYFATSTRPGGDLLADSVACIAVWADETVYVGTTRGVGQIDRAGGVDSYNPDAARLLGRDFKGTLLHDLVADSLHVWVATDSGVSRYPRQPPYTAVHLPDSLPRGDVFALLRSGGRILAGNAVGVFEWQETSRAWHRIRNFNDTDPLRPTTPTFTVRSLSRLANGRLFAGCDNSIQYFNGFVWGPLSPPALYLLNDRRFAAIATLGDTLWVNQSNLDGEGGDLERWCFADPNWRRYVPNGLPGSSVRDMAIAPGGTLWAGTYLGGVAARGQSGRWCAYNGNDPLVRPHMADPSGRVSALAAGSDGRVWFHAVPQTNLSAPIDVLAPDASCSHAADVWSRVAPGDNDFTGRYLQAKVDGEGNIFFLCDGQPGAIPNGGGIDVTSADGTRALHIGPEVLGGAGVGALAFETTNGAWSRAYVGLNNAGSDGLLLWNRSGQLLPPTLPPTSLNFTVLRLPDSLSVAEYRDIAVMPESAQKIWVATGNGIFQYDAATRRVLSVMGAKRDAKPGLLSVDVKDLAFDTAGNLWVATVVGVNRLRLAERQPGREVIVDAFTTIDVIRDLNGSSGAGQLYDPTRSLAPLPSPKVYRLAYDAGRDVLHFATDAGMAAVDVAALSSTASVPLAGAIVYPNPVRADAGHTEVRIGRISDPATVAIYTLEGEMVCEATDREDGDVIWKLCAPSCLETEGSYLAATGTYLVRITTRAGSTVRTLVVIR